MTRKTIYEIEKDASIFVDIWRKNTYIERPKVETEVAQNCNNSGKTRKNVQNSSYPITHTKLNTIGQVNQ